MISGVARLVAAIWFGGGLFLAAAAAPAAFSASSGPADAANVVGAMLTRWHYLALGAPLILLVLEWVPHRPARTLRVWILGAALLLAGGEAAVDLGIRHIRASAVTPISELPRDHPTRRDFGRLHGISMSLLALQVICAGIVVAGREGGVESRGPSGNRPSR